jgi:uncharacterized protein (TIGR00297 family)
MTCITSANANEPELCAPRPPVAPDFVLTLTNPAPWPAALVASLLIAAAAWQQRGLTRSGAVAAAVIGACALCVSWGAGIFLVAWFVMATTISKVGKEKKSQRILGMVEKGGQRDAGQVLANGGVFLLLTATLLLAGPACAAHSRCGYLLSVAAAGSLAAAGADTWATEIGTLAGGSPWSLRTASRVAVGTSGAVTLSGTVAMIAGAGLLALLAGWCSFVPTETRTVLAVATGGLLGAMTDTLIGAFVQERRWCDRCSMETEQQIHVCEAQTRHLGGLSGLSNDAVNGLCAMAGALGAVSAVLL